MKNHISSIIIVLMISVLGLQPTYAAFPAHAENNTAVKTEKRSFDKLINETIEKYNLPAPRISDGASDGGGALSIVSLALGVVGLAAIIAAFAAFAPALLAVAAGCGIAAIILGAMGSRRRPLRGVGIAGFALGIVDVSILLVILFITLLVLALFEQ